MPECRASYSRRVPPSALATGRRRLQRLLRSLVTFAPAPGRSRRALRWVAATAASLIIISVILGPDKGGMGLLGAMSAGGGRDFPTRRRVLVGIRVGATVLACQAIGLLISPWPLLVPPVMTAMTFVVVWSWHALLTGPPGPINTVFAGALGVYMGSLGWTCATLLPITALAWALALAASLILLALWPHTAERRAVEAAEQAVEAYCQQPRPDPWDARAASLSNRLRSQAWIAVDDAWHVLRTGRTPGTVPLTAEGRALDGRLRTSHLRLLERLQAESFPSEHPEISRHFNLVPLGLPSVRYLLRTAAQSGSQPRLVAGRAAGAVALAASVAFLLSPIGHPYWAIQSALIVLHMGASRADLTIRAAHRVIGTAAGLVVYVGIVSLGPGPWTRLGIAIVAIYGLEALAVRNYASSVVFVTVFGLMLTPAPSAAHTHLLITDRLGETAIGVGASVLMIWVMGRRAPILLVRRQFRQTLTRLLLVLDDMAKGLEDPAGLPPSRRPLPLLTAGEHDGSPTDLVRAHRRDLVFELGRAGAILSSQRPDDPESLEPWMRVQEEVSRLSYDVVAATWRQPGTGRAAARIAHRAIAEMIDALPPISQRRIDPTAVAGTVAVIRAEFLASA